MAKDAVNVVFLAQSISGHLNIHLAVLEHLLTSPTPASNAGRPAPDLHLVSFAPAAKQAARLSALADATPDGPRFTFHTLGDVSLFTEMTSNGLVQRHGPATLRHLGLYKHLASTVGFDPEIYVAVYERIVHIFREEVKPRVDLAVVDIFMPMGEDACMTEGVRWGMLAPNSGMDISKYIDPKLSGFWKYPAPYSSIKYPVPFRKSLYSIALNVVFIYLLLSQSRIRVLDRARAQAGMKGKLFIRKRTHLPFAICSSVREIEYPHDSPSNVVYPGPILVPVPVVATERYPDLTAFLDRKRTIVMNMGSLFAYNKEDVENVVSAIRRAREAGDKMDFQVLWKLNGMKEYEDVLRTGLGDAADDVRCENWIEAPMLAVLQHPNVVGFVHHGGANSFHEAAYAAVPQIILPQWVDLYDFAVRAEWLRLGIYANKGFEAQIKAEQLADAFVKVLVDEGGAWKKRAVEISEACHRGGGVAKVGSTILEAALT
ncbi:UDP-Glycosyltransferase/glycogen phosphorylase [Trametopsis cervina]|nr:UDP-Glycosyltransferase/glycogen phosphorylase [Trametopsis cervina]